MLICSPPDKDFSTSTSFLYKIWFIMTSTTVTRFKYYHAWLLADAICNNSGLGFNGYDEDGNVKWDLISNINVVSFEVSLLLTKDETRQPRETHTFFFLLPTQLATNVRDAINNWNLGTNRWLRTVVYDRVPKEYGTYLVFALSCLWHGFYPGYYLTFAYMALVVTAARTVSCRFILHRKSLALWNFC